MNAARMYWRNIGALARSNALMRWGVWGVCAHIKGSALAQSWRSRRRAGRQTGKDAGGTLSASWRLLRGAGRCSLPGEGTARPGGVGPNQRGSALPKARRKKREAEDYTPSRAFTLHGGSTNAETAGNAAKLITGAAVAATRVIVATEAVSALGEFVDVPALMNELNVQGLSVNRGDLSQAEVMLANQATALQSVFARLAELAMTSKNIPTFEAYMRMALRSQSQCRTTLETIAVIKNPPAIFTRQTNITSGPQQINNRLNLPTQAREFESGQNKLSGDLNGLLPDAGTSTPSCRTNPKVGALEVLNRAEDGGGEIAGSAKRVQRRPQRNAKGPA